VTRPPVSGFPMHRASPPATVSHRLSSAADRHDGSAQVARAGKARAGWSGSRPVRSRPLHRASKQSDEVAFYRICSPVMRQRPEVFDGAGTGP
jgi:hypothetical protein